MFKITFKDLFTKKFENSQLKFIVQKIVMFIVQKILMFIEKKSLWHVGSMISLLTMLCIP